jgi:hypothetical protein
MPQILLNTLLLCVLVGASSTDIFATAGAQTLLESSVEPCTGTTIDVDSSTLNPVLKENEGGNITLNLAPGRYPEFPGDIANFECVELRCTAAAVVAGVPNPDGCVMTAAVVVVDTKTFIIEKMVFQMDATVPSETNHDYGIAVYRANAVRIANNAFSGKMYHDISTKEKVKYAEVIGNLFVKCAHHCLEIGQNGNVPSLPSTCEMMIVRSNIFDSPIESAITQRYNRELIVDNNEFINATRMVENIPFWAPYDPGTGAELNLVPEAPLRTTVTNNIFVGSTGSNNLLFEGRGVLDDEVLIQGNSGPLTCERWRMEPRVVEAHANEQTTNPSRIEPDSDISCPIVY